MRPVPDTFGVTQAFGSYATGGVTADPNGTEVQQLVASYGNYQPYGHAGQDIGTPIGTPVHAIAAGTVLWADWGTNLPGDDSDAGYRQRWYLYKTFPGIVIVIQHDGWKGVYAHLSETPLNVGDTVTEGQQIALSGNTRSPGVTLGAHLHVEALIDDSYATGNGLIYGRTDPTPYYGSGSVNLASIPTTPSPSPQEDTLSDAQVDAIVGAMTTLFKQWHDGTRAEIEKKIDTAVGDLEKWVIDTVTAAKETTILDNRAQIGTIPSAVLGFNYRPGANIAGALDAIAAKPSAGTVTNAPADPQAIADAVAVTLSTKLGK